MCFFIHSKHEKAKIAKKDIICYKAFEATKSKKYLRSPFKGYRYEMEECYYENKMAPEYNYKIKRGLHSYSSKTGFRRHFWVSDMIVKCIIPEGATYYYNPERGEYVSDYLIIGTDKDIIK